MSTSIHIRLRITEPPTFSTIKDAYNFNKEYVNTQNQQDYILRCYTSYAFQEDKSAAGSKDEQEFFLRTTNFSQTRTQHQVEFATRRKNCQKSNEMFCIPESPSSFGKTYHLSNCQLQWPKNFVLLSHLHLRIENKELFCQRALTFSVEIWKISMVIFGASHPKSRGMFNVL